MGANKTWYGITQLNSVDLCGYAKDISYHPYRMNASYWVLALIESGQRTVKVDGVPIKVKNGDFKILPPGSLQEPMELDHQSAYYIHFHACGGKIEPPKSVNSEKILLPICDHLPSELNCLELARYIYNQSMKPYIGQTFLQNQLLSLLSILSLHVQRSDIWLRGVSSHCESILTFIEKNVCVSLHSSDYEKAFNLGYHQLNAVFKQRFGYTIKQYHFKTRMRHAAYLLLSGKSVREAAQLCGYEDYYFFIRSFTKEYGIAPGQYQKQNGIR